MGLYFSESVTVVYLTVNVTNDTVPLEAGEEYSLLISNTNPSEDVTVANVGTIRIIDDDGKHMYVLSGSHNCLHGTSISSSLV